MCGIAGMIGKNDPESVMKMSQAQRHRGPDALDVKDFENVPITLGHTRLSIIDLSDAGRQPMSYAQGRYTIVFNGEIYNYAELRDELAKLGCPFETRTDTEVILAAFSKWGAECVKRFRGMFAFVLVDQGASGGEWQVFAARDRFGIKPLYFMCADDVLYFASETRAICAGLGRKPAIHPQAFLDYMRYGSVREPKTIYEGIQAFPPASCGFFNGTGFSTQLYWDLHTETADLRKTLQSVSYQQAKEEVRRLLKEAAACHMVADVTVGAFLSGGVDSTSAVGLMSKVSERPVKTFTVGFERKHSAYDEREFARRAAEQLNAEHREVLIRDEDVPEIFTGFIQSMDQPSLDGLNTWIVSREAARDVKVAISGLGADEYFAGYGLFDVYQKICDTKGRVSNIISKIASVLSYLIGIDSFLHKIRVSFAAPKEKLSFIRRVCTEVQIRRAVCRNLLNQDRSPYEEFQSLLRADADPVQQVSFSEIRGYLKNTLLRDTDVQSMAHSLEVRPFLLDHKLVEYVYALPARFKLDGSAHKKILKDAVKEYIPTEDLLRTKMGFVLPTRHWARGCLKESINELLQDDSLRLYFKRSFLRQMKLCMKLGIYRHTFWSVFVFASWLNQNRLQEN